MDAPRSAGNVRFDVESPVAPNMGPTSYPPMHGDGMYDDTYNKDTHTPQGAARYTKPAQVAPDSPVRPRSAHIPTLATIPADATVEWDPVYGNQVFNVQWVLLMFWPLVIPSIVAAFMPLCKSGKRFPTLSYQRAWIGNLIIAIVMTILWIIIIAVSARYSSTYYYYV